MGRKTEEGQITLYRHPIGQEIGLINLVIPAPYDPDSPDQTIMILTSEYEIDEGVVFTVIMFKEHYDEMCQDYEVETLEGCILSTFGDDLSLEEVPEEPPSKRPETLQEGKLRVLGTPNLWRHKWGRCCCVQRGDELVPVTRDAINEGKVPWWHSPYTPYELDLIDAALDPEHKAMHVLLDSDMICGKCGEHVWVVHPEKVPEELPEPPLYIEIESESDDQQALEEIVWNSKREAWEIFYDDDHNNSVIQESKLAIERSNKRKRYAQKSAFEAFNRATHNINNNIHTVKQAFCASLGQSKTGTWADFNLEMLRMVKGLEEVDLPMEILEMVRLEDQDTEHGVKNKEEKRAIKASVDHDATILQFLLDEESAHDDNDDDEFEVTMLLEEDDIIDEIADDEAPNEPVRETARQDSRPKAVPRVQRTNKQEPERPTPKKRVKSKSKIKIAKENLIDACKLLQESLTSFIQVLQEDEEYEDVTSKETAQSASNGED